MAMKNLERARAEIDLLSRGERRLLAEYLMEKDSVPGSSEFDINSLRGSIQLTIDPLDYQHASRAERD